MTAAPYWDPFDRALHVAPHEAWKRLRNEAPVYHNERYGFYALSRFADVLEASLDTDTFSSAHGVTLDDMTEDVRPAPRAMIMMDPPMHTGLRKMVNRTFFRNRVAALEDDVRKIATRFLDSVADAPGFDYVQDFSMKLPVMVISTLLGFPEEDHDMLREWSDAQLHRDEGELGLSDHGRDAHVQLMSYYRTQLDTRRRRPREDLVSSLMTTELTEPDGTQRWLRDDELVIFMALINVAGNETVARLLGWAALTLARFPDQRAKLVENPDLMASAVEELLRFEAPSPVQGRFTTRDVTYHGTVIPAGSRVALLTGSAGRDGREFADPDIFDVSREQVRHISLGHGAHFCLGAALARLEARVALEETLARFPTWEVDEAAVTYVHTSTVRGPASVPILT